MEGTETEAPLWRVWMQDGPWVLRRAEDKDAVYRGFKPKKRALITRVDRVLKTSEGTQIPQTGGAGRRRLR